LEIFVEKEMTLAKPSLEIDEADESTWPREVGLIISALEAGAPAEDRRQASRRSFRTQAILQLYTDESLSVDRVLYTRDVNQRSLGFVTKHRLPLGYGGTVQIADFEGKLHTIPCTLLRCRQAASGWYEGGLYFNRDQWQFAPE
jgi:hypothetical protein